jgi:hypothetical protein
VLDGDAFGIHFGSDDLCFCPTKSCALGEQTNGYTDVGYSFVPEAVSDEGSYALNNGEKAGFVFTAFQVLLVKPVEGLSKCPKLVPFWMPPFVFIF